jgi:hypothetical protein
MAVPDLVVIVHAFFSVGHSSGRVAEKRHVAPQRATKETKAAEREITVFKNDHVRALGFPLQPIDEAREFVPIKLVVAGNINDGDLDPLVKDPPHPSRADMGIARQNDEVGADVGDDEIPELDVQIREDMEFHEAALLP